tara:strand:- start:1816 stop:2439 length:624 start_codon:yes stop_codon:yes gene_type:complete
MKSYKFKFRGKELSRTQVKNNILAVLNQADKESFDFGKRWYTIANGIAVNLTGEGVNQAQAVGVIAALSPLKSWKQNIKLAREFVFEGKRGGHTGVMVKKASDILALNNPTTDEVIEILRGQKIVNFFLNIYFPNKDIAVTIDRHAVGIALIGTKKIKQTEEDGQITKAQFEFLVHCYKWAAAELDMSAVQLQAITWEHFRKVKVKK